MTSLLHQKKRKQPPTGRSGSLSPGMGFLEVIQDACNRDGRYTLTAESKGLSYAVMVDRNGPFNVTGGGYTGSAALAMAAELRSGTYTMSEGWPELQPYYQLGLDTTLKNLVSGHARSGIEELPVARGVDWIRNAEDDPRPTPPSRTDEAEPGPPVARRQDVSVPWAGPDNAPASATLGNATMLAVHSIPAPAPAPARTRRASMEAPGRPPAVEANGRPVSVTGPNATPVDVRGAMTQRGVTVPDTFSDGASEIDATAPGGSGASQGQGPLKHVATRFLLWTIRMDEPARFNLSQACVLVGRSLRSDYSFLLRPIRREVIQRWRLAGEDWRKSGDAMTKQKSRRRAPGYVAKEK